jgi:transcriptional regulator with XRE-family HTH domain
MGRVKPLNPGIVQLLGKQLGLAIAEVRERRKFSREDLAALAGVSPKAVEHREMGRADHPRQRETSEETLS